MFWGVKRGKGERGMWRKGRKESNIRGLVFFFYTKRRLVKQGIHWRSPRIRRANWMSLGMIVTRFAWIAHKLVSSKR